MDFGECGRWTNLSQNTKWIITEFALEETVISFDSDGNPLRADRTVRTTERPATIINLASLYSSRDSQVDGSNT